MKSRRAQSAANNQKWETSFALNVATSLRDCLPAQHLTAFSTLSNVSNVTMRIERGGAQVGYL